MFTPQEITDEIYDLFEPQEGFNCVYYGKIGNGKTRNATADILELLSHGEVVFANWKIDFRGFNELENKKVIFSKFLGGRRNFFNFDKSNFHYLDYDALINDEQNQIEYLNKLVGAHLFIDEGQWIFNSLEKAGNKDEGAIAKTKLILHGRHYCRSLNVITQRATNIHKNIRSQVHIWYRCVKVFSFWKFIIFQRWAIEDMKDDMPVELITKYDREGRAIKDAPNGKLKTYFVNIKTDKVFPAYNTHAMRSADSIYLPPVFEAYNLDFKDRFGLLFRTTLPTLARLGKALQGRRKKAPSELPVIIVKPGGQQNSLPYMEVSSSEPRKLFVREVEKQ